jgi:hypothetical protein
MKRNKQSDKEEGSTKMVTDIFKNLVVSINKLHIRYEDDYFPIEKPYSFGILIDVGSFFTLVEFDMGRKQK